eukprot:15480314-Alexandrium_andersonii.AAC.1
MQGNGVRGTAQGDVSTYKASIQHGGQWAWDCALCGGWSHANRQTCFRCGEHKYPHALYNP